MGLLPPAKASMDLRILPSDGREGRRYLWGEGRAYRFNDGDDRVSSFAAEVDPTVGGTMGE